MLGWFYKKQRTVAILPTVAVALGIPTRDLQAVIDDELRPWIDNTFEPELELRVSLKELAALMPEARAKQPRRGTRLIPAVKQREKPKLAPYPWQERAIEAWKKAGCRGMVEAVTGCGKTHLGVMAIEYVRQRPEKVYPLVVTPTIPIMQQWVQRLEQAFPECRVGMIGGGRHDDFATPGTVAVVGVINSLVLKDAKRLRALFGFAENTLAETLLVADECHHYLEGVTFAKIRSYPFDRTLALSATIDSYEVDGLGRMVFEYGFKEAHADGLMPPFDMINCRVPLNRKEQHQHKKLTQKIRDAFDAVVEAYDELHEDDPDIWKRMKQLMGPMGSGDEPLIEQLFKFLFRRAAICYTAEQKLSLTERLVLKLVSEQGKKVMVFLERIESADEVVSAVERRVADGIRGHVLQEADIRCFMYHSDMGSKARATTLRTFREGGPAALIACRCLDEGVDLPDVDAAVLTSSTQSTRQRIQRIGRVLRKGDGSKRPTVVTLSVEGTSDDEIPADDSALFSGVARIFRVSGPKKCLELVSQLPERTS